MITLILVFVNIILLLVYKASTKFRYWSDRNVKTYPLFQTTVQTWKVLFGKLSVAELVAASYEKVQDVRYMGGYQTFTPELILKCPDLIKKVCVKDFDHFLNRRQIIPDNTYELLTKSLISLKGSRWKEMRATTSSSFTSSKMKSMFQLMCENAKAFNNFFIRRNEILVVVELKDAFARYANDIIANVAFGLQVNSLEERNNEFFLMTREVLSITSSWKRLKLLLVMIAPSLVKLCGISIIERKVHQFFMNIVKDTIRMREEENIKRPDMLGILMEARKQKEERHSDDIQETGLAAVKEYLEIKTPKSSLSDGDIAAQLFIFLIAGFDNISSAMCFMAYELALNLEIQQKLIQEIDDNIASNGSATYETIVGMKYMDMVVTESLRKWPLAIVTDRIVTKPYRIEPKLPGEKPLHLELNDLVTIPIIGIHYDSRFYKNPKKFDPERFSPENKTKTNPYTYLPFGVGPRNCIGSRFAILVMKTVFFYLLSKFETVPVEKTQIPLQISKETFSLTSENGFPLGLKRRD